MQVRDEELPRSPVARTGKELNRKARVRLDWMDFHRRSRNLAFACRHFGISRQTFYRWRRYDPLNLTTLQGRSHRQHRRRSPTWSPRLADRVLALRQRYPLWGNDKMTVLLRQQKLAFLASMVARILTQLMHHGWLLEAPRGSVPGGRRALRPRPKPSANPKQYAASQPGDLVQVEMHEVRLSQLPNPAAVSAAGFISKQGMKSVTHSLDGYRGRADPVRRLQLLSHAATTQASSHWLSRKPFS
jgi:hypothetical protein